MNSLVDVISSCKSNIKEEIILTFPKLKSTSNEEVIMTILMLMWMKMNIMLTWITMTEIVMVNDDNYDADVDDNRCG